jgi:hypothetical protein
VEEELEKIFKIFTNTAYLVVVASLNIEKSLFRV